jgi:hypothetical protein
MAHSILDDRRGSRVVNQSPEASDSIPSSADVSGGSAEAKLSWRCVSNALRMNTSDTDTGPASVKVPTPPENILEHPEEEEDERGKLTFRIGFHPVSLVVRDPPPGVPHEPEEEDQGDQLKFKADAGAISVKIPETPISVPDDPEDEQEDHGGALRFKTADGAVSLIIPRAPEDLPDDLPEEPPEEEEEEPIAPLPQEEYHRRSPATWAPPLAPGEPLRALPLDPARRRRALLARVVGSLALIDLEFGGEH